MLAQLLDAVVQKGKDEWSVRSQAGWGFYRVRRTRKRWTYECESAIHLAPARCKHVHAVLLALYPNELGLTPPNLKNRPVHRQLKEWRKRRRPQYEAALQAEEPLYDSLLWGLCDDIPEPLAYPGKVGRKPIPLRVQAFIAVRKVSMRKGALRARGRMVADYCDGKGVLGQVPNYATASRFLNNPLAPKILLGMIHRAAAPLTAIEDAGTLAIDSSGFSLSHRGWYRFTEYEGESPKKFVEAHVCVGTKTKIVTDVRVALGPSGDSPKFISLLQGSVNIGFHPENVVGDGAYNSRINAQAAADLGVRPLLPFKAGTTGKSKGYIAYHRMWLLFSMERPKWDLLYHDRSNVETVFGAIKTRVGGDVYSRNLAAQLAELLSRIVNRNLAVLTRSVYEFGLDPAKFDLPPPLDASSDSEQEGQ